MASIIERITQAEQEAVNIKKEASVKAKRLISDAELSAKNEVADAAKRAAKLKLNSAAKAEEDAKGLSSEITGKNNGEADQFCESAKRNMDQAVSYIVERALAL